MILGAKLKDFQLIRRTAEDGYAIKVPVFSFDKFPNLDKSLGPEMKSTASLPAGGRAIYFIKDLKDPFCHCEAWLCWPWQRQVYGERSMYLSR